MAQRLKRLSGMCETLVLFNVLSVNIIAYRIGGCLKIHLDLVSSVCMSRSGIAGSYGSSISSFWQ